MRIKNGVFSIILEDRNPINTPSSIDWPCKLSLASLILDAKWYAFAYSQHSTCSGAKQTLITLRVFICDWLMILAATGATPILRFLETNLEPTALIALRPSVSSLRSDDFWILPNSLLTRSVVML